MQFTESEVRSDSKVNDDKIIDCIEDCVEQSKNFVHFLNDLIKNSQSKQLEGLAKVVVNHIIRESQYFVGIAELIL